MAEPWDTIIVCLLWIGAGLTLIILLWGSIRFRSMALALALTTILVWPIASEQILTWARGRAWDEHQTSALDRTGIWGMTPLQFISNVTKLTWIVHLLLGMVTSIALYRMARAARRRAPQSP